MERAALLKSCQAQVQKLSKDLPAQVLQLVNCCSRTTHRGADPSPWYSPTNLYSAAAGTLETQSRRDHAIHEYLWDTWN